MTAVSMGLLLFFRHGPLVHRKTEQSLPVTYLFIEYFVAFEFCLAIVRSLLKTSGMVRFLKHVPISKIQRGNGEIKKGKNTLQAKK